MLSILCSLTDIINVLTSPGAGFGHVSAVSVLTKKQTTCRSRPEATCTVRERVTQQADNKAHAIVT